MLAEMPGGRMLDNAAKMKIAPIGRELSSMWLCEGSREMAFADGASAPIHRLPSEF
jgi:hypothetical protein